MTAVAGQGWSQADRAPSLARAESHGVDVLVVGGGITGAGIVRDAASRGLRALLVEREDFAVGTSSRSSKMIHGGLRYIGEGQLGMTREACRERDLMMRLNPHLVRPVSFLFPTYRHGKVTFLKLRSALWIYRALANFRDTARFRMVGPDEVLRFAPGLRREELVGAGVYTDGQTDDARLVLETLRSARRLGAGVVNHAEPTEFVRAPDGRISGARLRDRRSGRSYRVHAHVVVNAAGAAVERLRGLDREVQHPELRPAKGVHLVIPGDRLPVAGVVAIEARDGRHLFLAPCDDVALIGTTDAFTDEIDEPTATIAEVHYLLDAVNEAFPRAGLTTNDIRSVFAGVRPLVAAPEESKPSTSVSRDHRIYEDPSGLISVAGGKLTTHRATGEEVMQRVLRWLPAERRTAAGPSRTATLPLREAAFVWSELVGALQDGFGLPAHVAAHLARTYGADAERLLNAAPAEERAAVGRSRFAWAEVRWAFDQECAVTLCDLLERRMRLAIFATGQGLPELDHIAALAAEAAGWDAERIRQEAAGYAHIVRSRYQIEPPARARDAA